VLAAEHYKNTTLQRISEIIPVPIIYEWVTRSLSKYLQDVKINSCRTLRIALQIQEEKLLMFIPKLVHV
jgi:flagellar biosynthesis protein FliQ